MATGRLVGAADLAFVEPSTRSTPISYDKNIPGEGMDEQLLRWVLLG